MSRFSGGPGMNNHLILIQDKPGPDGHLVRCYVHGYLGHTDTTLDAYILACEHDDEYGKDWL